MSIDPALASQIPITWTTVSSPTFTFDGQIYSVYSGSYRDIEELISYLPPRDITRTWPAIAIYLLEMYEERIYMRYARLNQRQEINDSNIPMPESFPITPIQEEDAAIPEHPFYTKQGEILSAEKYNRLVDIALDNQKKLDLIIECIKKGRVNNAISELEI